MLDLKDEETLSTLIKAQIRLEKEIGEKLSSLEQRVDSIGARLLIREMQLDTKKHAEILQEALKAAGTKSFWDYTIHIDADKQSVKRELQGHIKAEEKMMQHLKEEAKKTDDDALKLLLNHFAEDEKKHHKYLKTILEKTYKIDV